MLEVSRFRVQGSGCVGCRDHLSENVGSRDVRLREARFLLWSLGFGVWGLRFGGWGVGFGVWGVGFQNHLHGRLNMPHPAWILLVWRNDSRAVVK